MRGRGKRLNRERAKEIARLRWERVRRERELERAPAEMIPQVDPAVAQRMARRDAERHEREREELRRLKIARGEVVEDLELEQGGSSAPSSGASTLETTPPPSASGSDKNFAGTVNAAAEPQAPQEPAPEGPEELRHRLVAEELARQREVAKQRAVGRRETAVRGPAGPARPGSRQGAYLKADAVRPEEFRKPTLAPGSVPGRRPDPPQAPPAAAPSAPAGLLVLETACECCSLKLRALTGHGRDVRQREHLASSPSCKVWSSERDVAFRDALVHVPPEEHVALQAIEPTPPPPATQPVRPGRHGRVAELLPSFRGNFSPEPGDSEFPTSTVTSREEFSSEPDLD